MCDEPQISGIDKCHETARLRYRENNLTVVRRICIGLMLTMMVALVGWRFTGPPKALRNNLWRVVHYGCVPNQRAFGRPAPCEKVDQGRGFALVPSVEFANELLLVPTLRIRGIEDTRLLNPQTPNYWADAWAERSNLATKGLAVPDDWVGLAVNSAYTRSQDQLHIHIDCIQSSTYDALRTSNIGLNWKLIEPLPGRRYWARYLSAADFASVSPFRTVGGSVASSSMGRQTIVAVRANGGVAGFYILRQTYDRATHAPGFGEELLDHRCRGLRKALSASNWSVR